MTFGAPLNFLWLLPALGAITIIYLMRKPRKDIAVPSTLFWSLLPEQSMRATRFQKFVPELLFFLQALAALLLIIAAAQPLVLTSAKQSRNWAIIIDNGGSMNATDGQATRLDTAKDRASAFLNTQSGSDDNYVIVTAAGAPSVDLSPTHIRASENAAIASIPPTDEHSDIGGAVAVASDALKNIHGTPANSRIVIFSDGAFDSSVDSSAMKSASGIPTSLVHIARGDDANAAITRLVVQRDPVYPSQRLDIYAEVRTYGTSHPVNAELTLSTGSSVELTQSVTIAPGRPTSISATIDAPQAETVLKAELKTEADSLADDDSAYAILSSSGSTRLLLITDGDPPLERALALLPGVSVDVASLANFQRFGAPSGYDGYVVDAGDTSVSAAGLPGNSLIWGGAEPKFVTTDTATAQIVDWDRAHPVMRFLDLSDISLNAPSWIFTGAWAPLAEDSSGTVIAALDSGGRRDIRASFSPKDSAFASSSAFPIFIANSIAWLTSQGGQSDIAGVPIALSPAAGGWTVRGPRGTTVSGVCTGAAGSPCTVEASLAGVYQAKSPSGELTFVRNFDPAASDITPKTHQFAVLSEGQPAAGAKRAWTAITGLVAALCVLLLATEWAVYHRGSPFHQPPSHRNRKGE